MNRNREGSPMERPLSPSTQLVLSYSRDASLLLTRRWLLEYLGVQCSCASNPAEFRTALPSESPDLIVLCQTLSHAECEEAKRLAAQHSPGVRLIVLFAHTATCVDDNDLPLDASGGPELFLRTIVRALRERSSASGGQAMEMRHAPRAAAAPPAQVASA